MSNSRTMEQILKEIREAYLDDRRRSLASAPPETERKVVALHGRRPPRPHAPQDIDLQKAAFLRPLPNR